jgi:pimeloyl-ACP methyl ester carboxylesterase
MSARTTRRQILALPLAAAASAAPLRAQPASAEPASALPVPAPTPAQPDLSRWAPYQPGREVVKELSTIVTPDGVQSLEAVTIGGIQQWISIRGADKANPILLFVHGGPGSTEMGMAWAFQRPWEDIFTVVHWDQRGAGKTYRANDPETIRPTLSFDRIAEDGAELIDLLTARFGKRKVVVVGHSWGSAVGLQMCLKRPGKVHAYVGVGQLIDGHENERVGYRNVMAAAKADNNAEAVRELQTIAPYPGPDPLPLAHMDMDRKWSIHYGGLTAYRRNADYYFHTLRLSPDYEPADLSVFDAGGLMSITTLLPQMMAVDFRPVTETAFPVVMFMGRHDTTTPPEIAAAWLERLQAPEKAAVWFENSAHLIPIEEPGRVFLALAQVVRPLAVDGETRGGAVRLTQMSAP